MTAPRIRSESRPAPARPRLRIRISSAAESAVRRGHPWVFEDSIRALNREGDLGELAVIYDRRDRFLAAGLFDPASPLRVRILHQGTPMSIERAWWKGRLTTAIDRRLRLFASDTTGYRWIHGENDGWPGLVLDRYGQTLVCKLYTAAWLPRLQEIVPLFQETLKPERIVLRLSRNIQTLAHDRFACVDGQVVVGPSLIEPVEFLETGLRFVADVKRGQKTGFFFDQRENRRRVEEFAREARILNLFSYSSGFSLYAARGGATSAIDVDLSDQALRAGQQNFELNQSIPEVRRCVRQGIKANGFEWLNAAPAKTFDLIVIDPPSLAKREVERGRALSAYLRLVDAATKRLETNGVLVAASCSAHVSSHEFFHQVRAAVQRAQRPITELGETFGPADHPVVFPEAAYLKCIYLRLGRRNNSKRVQGRSQLS